MYDVLKVTQLKQTLKSPGTPEKLVLKGLNFSIPRGALAGFIGVNGAGKTTTIKSILNFIHPQSGDIQFFGEQGLTVGGRQKLGFMPERPYFYDFLTGREFLALHWRLRGQKLDDLFERRCVESLKAVDLERAKNLRLRQFSKGMLQRIGIAQAIIHRPEFLILDEPMSGLDPDGRLLIKKIIKELHHSGTTIFFSSHLLQDMEELCDRLVIIDQGAIIFEGNLADLKAQSDDSYEITIRNPSGTMEKLQASRRDLQSLIDVKRSEKAEVLQIQARTMSLDEAFVLLRQKKVEQR